MYRALIHHKPELPSIIKFQQLRTHLSGEALEIIKNIGIVEENYDQAWKALLDYYDNNRRLVANYHKIILDAQPMKNGSSDELKRLQREMIGSLDSLIALTMDVDDAGLFIALMVRRFDNNTYRDWYKCLGSDNQPPTLKRLREFVTNYILTLELLLSKQTYPKSSDQSHRETRSKSNVHQTIASSSSRGCPCCKGNHPLYRCEEFKKKEFSKKYDIVKAGRKYFNYLGSHNIKNCPSNFKCQECKGTHNTLLHPDKGKNELTNSSSPQINANTSDMHCTNVLPSYGSDVLLATAQVYVVGQGGQRHLVCALIDPCSQSSLVLKSLSNILKLKHSPANVSLRGINDQPLGHTSSSVNLTISPRFNSKFKLEVKALIVSKVSSYRPPQKIKTSSLPYLQGLELADPYYYKNDPTDILLSATVHAHIIEEGIKRGPPNLPIASLSLLGWLISGPVPSTGAPSKDLVTLYCSEEPLLSDLLQRFWDVEEVSVCSDKRNKDEIDCETHFEESHSCDARGRFCVRLPFIKDPKILEEQRAESFNVASAMFKRLERRFEENPKLKEAYSAFIKEYVDLDHMTKIDPSKDDTVCYLPHHGVIRESSSTTKLRVVFNGSSSSKAGVSLNNCFYIGPNLLPNLFDLVLRWRNYQFAFSADIEKMFRQIKAAKPDQKYQAILWRESPYHNLQTFQLTTVTYGLTSSPYQTCKVLKTLAECYQSSLPLGSEALKKEVYMNDVISRGYSIEEATEKIRQLNDVTTKGCLPFRKWSSNCPSLLSQLPASSLATKSLDLSEMSQDVSVLELYWCPIKDKFTFKLKPTSTQKSWTKRTMLSQLAQFFDPLGWLAPTIITAKIILQSLWLIKLNWDDNLSGEVTSNWNKCLGGVESLNSIKIPRWNNISLDSTSIEVHGFADASKSAYAAVVYIRVVGKN